MKKQKSRMDRLNQYYVTTSDLQIILNISYKKAKELFNKVDEEEKEICSFKAHETKVELKRALKKAGIDYNFLLKQIKNAHQVELESVY